MAPADMDRFAAAGMAATWWEESFHELETAANRGWTAVIDAWLTTAEASADDKNAPDLADQTAIKLLAGHELTARTDLAADTCSPRRRDQKPPKPPTMKTRSPTTTPSARPRSRS